MTDIIILHTDKIFLILCQIIISNYIECHSLISQEQIMRDLGIRDTDDYLGFVINEEQLSYLMIKYSSTFDEWGNYRI